MSSSDLQVTNSECIVIGGGITGLIIATILQRRGIKVIVLDKSPDVGGRLATRSISLDNSLEGIFDYGTQYLNITNPKFQVWVDEWLKNDVIKTWSEGSQGGKEKTIYCGVDGMVGIAKYLEKDLDVRTNTEVIEFKYDKKWLIETEKKGQYQGDMLVMTSTIPQSLSLLDASFVALPLEVRFSLEDIKYDSSIVVLALLEQPSNIKPPGIMNLNDYSLARIVDNHQKGISPHGNAITLQATPEFSDTYWDSDDAEIAYKLITSAADYLNSAVIKYEIHRWRYSFPRTVYSESFLSLLELPLIMAGDAFVAPSLEGAVISGITAGASICRKFRGK